MLACDLAVPDSRLIGPSRLQPDQELRRAEQRRGVAGAATGYSGRSGTTPLGSKAGPAGDDVRAVRGGVLGRHLVSPLDSGLISTVA